jgi:hypothetical protein
MIMSYGSLIRKTHRKSARVLVPAAAVSKGSVTLTTASLAVPPPVVLEPIGVA